jgi:hypothetical protein
MLKAFVLAATVAALALPAVPAFADTPAQLACKSALEGQRTIVRKEAVRAVDHSYRVSIVPFCMGIQLNDFGNAAGLGKTIGSNPVLAAALARHGWRADDVTSIAINGNWVRLYIHRE